MEELHIYNEPLGIDGTISQLIDWAYRYDDDYSDEALDYIAAKARELGVEEEKCLIPILVKLTGRERPKTMIPFPTNP